MSDIAVTGVDFIARQTRDHGATARFHGETLRLPFVKALGHDARVRIPGRHLTLAARQSDAFGLESLPSGTMVAFAADDADAARRALEAKGVGSGLPLIYVQRQLGHASITTTQQVYGHLEESFLRPAADRVERLIWTPADASDAVNTAAVVRRVVPRPPRADSNAA